jgi:hypothetical protein
MGGYGVWRIGMKHPELYASIYSLSACCLMNNPQQSLTRLGPANAGKAEKKAAPPPLEKGRACCGRGFRRSRGVVAQSAESASILRPASG